jgi:hypothetical protein
MMWAVFFFVGWDGVGVFGITALDPSLHYYVRPLKRAGENDKGCVACGNGMRWGVF